MPSAVWRGEIKSEIMSYARFLTKRKLEVAKVSTDAHAAVLRGVRWTLGVQEKWGVKGPPASYNRQSLTQLWE